MKRLSRALLAALALALLPPAAGAAAGPNLLVMGEDADADTVPRDSRVFKRVLDALAEQAGERGFNVYDETALTLDGFAQGRTRRTDAELIDIARALRQPPIDVVMLFAVYARAERLSYTTRIHARIEGRLLNVATGQRLGSFEVGAPESWRVPVDCNRECMLETVGGNARVLARDLGAVLSEKLAHLAGSPAGGEGKDAAGGALPTAYTLVFDNFTEEDMFDIEEYLVVFSGYLNHRTTRSTMRHHEYWYESTIDPARLNRNLKKMLAHLEIRGRVAMDGNRVEIEKITVQGGARAKPKAGEW